MTKKCVGCGATLQYRNNNKDGYISEEKFEDVAYCERCFKIKNYGEYTVVTEDIEFDNIIKKINDENSLTVFLIDVLNINKESIDYIKKFTNDVMVLLTKKDVLPKSVKDKKVLDYFKENYLDINDIMCVSSYKNKNIDTFMNKVLKSNKKVYIVGLTNSGKSTFINALLKSIGMSPTVTTSAITNTTINFIEMKLDNNLTIIDTPGFVLKNSIYNFITFDEMKKITPLKEIKVKTFQMKPEETVLVDNLFRIDYLSDYKNSFSFYMNNSLNYNRMKIKTRKDLTVLPSKTLHVNEGEDILINGLGFIKISKECDIKIYTLDEQLISIRKSMI